MRSTTVPLQAGSGLPAPSSAGALFTIFTGYGRRPVSVSADTLVIGWGSTYGAIGAAARRVRATGRRVATAHLRYLNPFPANTGEVVAGYEKVLVPEMNLGQLSKLVRAEFLVDAQSLTKVQGFPFRAAEIETKILEMIDG